MITACQQRVAQFIEDARLIPAEVIGENQVQRGARLRLVLIMPGWIIPAGAGSHLLRGQAEHEKVFLTRRLGHLDGRAVTRAQRQGAVHHEFHVARAAGLVTRRGNLVGNIARRNQALGQRDIVFGQEKHLDFSARHGVAVNGARQVVDELDDDFGQVICGRRFAGEQKCARRHFEVWIGAQPVVKHDNAQGVEQLPLVFVDALDLAIENGV